MDLDAAVVLYNERYDSEHADFPPSVQVSKWNSTPPPTVNVAPEKSQASLRQIQVTAETPRPTAWHTNRSITRITWAFSRRREFCNWVLSMQYEWAHFMRQVQVNICTTQYWNTAGYRNLGTRCGLAYLMASYWVHPHDDDPQLKRCATMWFRPATPKDFWASSLVINGLALRSSDHTPLCIGSVRQNEGCRVPTGAQKELLCPLTTRYEECCHEKRFQLIATV